MLSNRHTGSHGKTHNQVPANHTPQHLQALFRSFQVLKHLATDYAVRAIATRFHLINVTHLEYQR